MDGESDLAVLKTSIGLAYHYADRWLRWDKAGRDWVVMEHGAGGAVREVYRGPDDDERSALDVLLGN
jgi:hypothetical protein